MFVYSESLALQEKENLKSVNRKLFNFNCTAGKSTNSTGVLGISIAMDARLENGIELCAELRLRVCKTNTFVQHAAKSSQVLVFFAIFSATLWNFNMKSCILIHCFCTHLCNLIVFNNGRVAGILA